MNPFIPVNEPKLDGNERKYLLQCLDTGWISSEGPFVKQFEDQFAQKMGRRFGVAVANGSLALDAAVAALGLNFGDEVIMPTFTIISCAAAIVRAGLIPVGIDCDSLTWNMDVQKIEEKINPKTKAIMVVHIYGLPVEMDRILQLAKKYSLKIIEDAAEVHGQTYRGKPCGGFGDISTFSFYPNKHVTTGEGGMILTDSEVLAEKCRSLRNLCFVPEKRFVHEELGWNMRMTNLQAALGVAQLERLDEFIVMKREMGQRYQDAFAKLDMIERPLSKTPDAENVYWVYGIVLNEKVPFGAEVAMQKLAKVGIGTRPFFWNMHEQPVFKKMGFFKNESHPVAERIARRGFYLPSGLGLTGSQQKTVIDKVIELFNERL